MNGIKFSNIYNMNSGLFEISEFFTKYLVCFFDEKIIYYKDIEEIVNNSSIKEIEQKISTLKIKNVFDKVLILDFHGNPSIILFNLIRFERSSNYSIFLDYDVKFLNRFTMGNYGLIDFCMYDLNDNLLKL